MWPILSGAPNGDHGLPGHPKKRPIPPHWPIPERYFSFYYSINMDVDNNVKNKIN